MSLEEIIIEKIRRDGPVSFRDFMEMALYYPGLGYYTSPTNKIGLQGSDYYTCSTLSPVFGAMIARQLEQMHYLVGEENFTIVEYGAGTGALCHAILGYLRENTALYGKVGYCIIEKSPAMREREKTNLHGLNISWCTAIEELQPLNGCILSNELVDNFAVHQVVMEHRLMEVFVDYSNDTFTEVLLPASQELVDYLDELHVQLPYGFRTEINLEATDWINSIAKALNKGYVMTIDYGFPSAELYRSYRNSGTLLCYNDHAINHDPYRNIGKQDITTHINFSALHHWGAKHGLHGCGFTDQANFLLSLGIENYINELAAEVCGKDYIKHLFLKHKLLNGLGDKFKVLVQQKNLPLHELTGLRQSPYIAAAKAA